MKFKMADSCHIENLFCYISMNYCPMYAHHVHAFGACVVRGRVIHRRVIVFLNESQLLALQPSEPVTLLNECAITCSIHALARVTAVSPDTIAIQYRTAVIPHSSDVSM